VSGDWGHLSNEQAVDFLSLIDQQRIQHILLGHISQQNNCLNRLQDLLTKVLSDATKVQYATQSEGSDWLAFES
jgi:phosphoribosyl 1,2-cyclic phosphodiesterase